MRRAADKQNKSRLERENEALRSLLAVDPCEHQWSIVTFKDGLMYGLGLEEECLKCLRRRAINYATSG